MSDAMTSLPADDPRRSATNTTDARSWTVGGKAIALIGAALLVDAAVETTWSGSLVRWWTVGAAVLYVMAVALTWRIRMDARARSGFVGLAILALLAVTVWLPEGLTHGVHLLGQPTAVVLCSATLAALLVAGVALLEATAIPLAGRVVAVLLVIYGLVAFGLGAWHATTYPSLFAGESAWRSAPRWLQGSVVAGVGALPIVLLVGLAGGLRRAGRAWHPQRIGALGLAVVMVAAGLTHSARLGQGGFMPASTGAFATNPGQAEISLASTPPATQDLAAYTDALAKLKGSIDHSEIDVQARQAKIGTDPGSIAKFVQNEIRYESYSGALRGPRGTLLARAGNSLDRALLLAAMLRAAGHKVRFAEGTLSPGQAEQLVRAGFPPAPPAFKSESPLMTITQRAANHFLYLGNTLHDAQFRPAEGDAGTWERTIGEAREHFWVEIDAGGRWVDLDPSPGLPYGQSLVPAATQKEEPDAKLFHSVEIRVEVETIRGGKRETQSVLQYSARASDLVGVPIAIFHQRQTDASTPILMLGESLIKGESFGSPMQIGMGGARASFPDAFGTGADRLSAEWLKFRVTSPVGERQAIYTIVDTEGEAARQSGAPAKAATTDTMATINDALNGFLGIGIATGRVPPGVFSAMMAEITDPVSETGLARMLALTASIYHAVRGLLPSSFLTPRPLWYVDAPSIVVARAQLRSAPPVPTVSLDLTLKGYRLLRTPDDPLAPRGPFYDHVAAGVLDHTAERWLLGTDQVSGSVGALFEAAAEQKVGPRVVTAPSSIPDDLLTGDGRLRLSAALERGQIAVVPRDRPKDWKPLLGWWSMDQRTGWTEDTTEDGGHPGEYTGSMQVPRAALARYVLLGCQVANVVALGVNAFVAGHSSAKGDSSVVAVGAAGAYANLALAIACTVASSAAGAGAPPGVQGARGGPAAPPWSGPPYSNVGRPVPPGNVVPWGGLGTPPPSPPPATPPPVNPAPYAATEPGGIPHAPTLPYGEDTIPGMPKIPW